MKATDGGSEDGSDTGSVTKKGKQKLTTGIDVSLTPDFRDKRSNNKKLPNSFFPHGGSHPSLREQCLLERATHLGGSHPSWREPHVLEGAPPLGGSNTSWKKPPLLEGATLLGGSHPLWREPPILEGATPNGGSHPSWREPPLLERAIQEAVAITI